MDQAESVKGRINYVNTSSGCGFIVIEDSMEDVLFTGDTEMEFAPEIGQEVTFERVGTNDGPRALELHRV